MRDRMRMLLANRWFSNAIFALIIMNAITLGLETSNAVMAQIGPVLLFLDKAFLAVFTIEIVMKLFVFRWAFFKDGWNIFDFIIVGIALMPSTGAFSVLRALRILRVLRLISVAPQLRRVVEGFVSALPGMASVFLLMGMIFYVFSVMATKLFSASFPEWFGTLGRSGYSLFQIMTLESWSMGIVRPVMEVYPYAWMFFVPFIMVTTFAVVNLLVGLIVNSMQDAHAEESNANTDAYREEVLKRLESIEARMNAQPKGEDAPN